MREVCANPSVKRKVIKPNHVGTRPRGIYVVYTSYLDNVHFNSTNVAALQICLITYMYLYVETQQQRVSSTCECTCILKVTCMSQCRLVFSVSVQKRFKHKTSLARVLASIITLDSSNQTLKFEDEQKRRQKDAHSGFTLYSWYNEVVIPQNH